MIQLKEYNPWAEIAEKFGSGLERGFAESFAKKKEQQQKQNLLRQLGILPSNEKPFSEKLGSPTQNQQDVDESMGMDNENFQEKNQSQTKVANSEDLMQKALAAQLVGEKEIGDNLMAQAKMAQKKEEIEHKERELPKQEYIKAEYKSLPAFMESIQNAEDKIPISEVSINMAEDAIEQPGKWAAFRDFLAEKTGYEGFRSAQGAELSSAIKQYFLGDLSSIKGGRPNQLIEKQLLDAYPRIGRDPISNQKILVGMKMQQELLKEKVRLTRDLEEKYLSEKGFLPPGFQSQVRKQLRPIADKLEKDTINKLTALSKYQKEYEKMAKSQLQKGESLMLAPDGSYEAIPKDKFQEAKSQGYIKLQ